MADQPEQNVCEGCLGALAPGAVRCAACGLPIPRDARPQVGGILAAVPGGPEALSAAATMAAPVPSPDPEGRGTETGQPPGSGDGAYAVRLTFVDGSDVILSADAVLGRKPDAAASQEGLLPVALIDPAKSSSRVHLRLHLTPEGVNVVDAGSGNGTRVEHGDALYPCIPGTPFWIEPGDRLWLGDVPVAVSMA